MLIERLKNSFSDFVFNGDEELIFFFSLVGRRVLEHMNRAIWFIAQFTYFKWKIQLGQDNNSKIWDTREENVFFFVRLMSNVVTYVCTGMCVCVRTIYFVASKYCCYQWVSSLNTVWKCKCVYDSPRVTSYRIQLFWIVLFLLALSLMHLNRVYTQNGLRDQWLIHSQFCVPPNFPHYWLLKLFGNELNLFPLFLSHCFFLCFVTIFIWCLQLHDCLAVYQIHIINKVKLFYSHFK